MPPKYDLRKLAPHEKPAKIGGKKKDDSIDLTKFSTTAEPKKTRARIRGNIIEVFQVKVRGRDASVNEANAYIAQTMKKLFARFPTIPEKQEKYYQVTYKLSDGRFYSSQQIKNTEMLFYPDISDMEYGIDHSLDLVVHINIMVIETVKK